MSATSPTGPNQFRVTESHINIYPHAVEQSTWIARENVWIWASVAVFRWASHAREFIAAQGGLVAAAKPLKAPRLTAKMANSRDAQCVIFHGFDGYDYGGHLIQVRKGVAKIRYRIGGGISDGEYQTTYLDREHWPRIKLT